MVVVDNHHHYKNDDVLIFFLFLLLLNIDEEAVTAAVRLCREYNEQHHLLFDVNNTSSTIILSKKFRFSRFNRHLNGLNHFSTIIASCSRSVFINSCYFIIQPSGHSNLCFSLSVMNRVMTLVFFWSGRRAK